MASRSKAVEPFCGGAEVVECGIWLQFSEVLQGFVYDIPMKLCEIFAYDKMRLC